MQFDKYADLYKSNTKNIADLWSADHDLIRNICASFVEKDATFFFHLIKILELNSWRNLMEEWKASALSPPPSPLDKTVYKNILDAIKLSEGALADLPACSVVLQCIFILSKPYLSRDDREFYIIDNPIKSEKILKIPYVSSTTWKGCFRAALRKLNDYPTFERRLLGAEEPPSGEERAGRLSFFPSFFKYQDKSIEVINPHKRTTKVGDVPVTIECVKTGAQATFTLLYCPFDLISSQDVQLSMDEMHKDLCMLPDALQALFSEEGFGAKTSAGFGKAKITSGSLCFRTPRSAQMNVLKFYGLDRKDAQPPGLHQQIEALVSLIGDGCQQGSSA